MPQGAASLSCANCDAPMSTVHGSYTFGKAKGSRIDLSCCRTSSLPCGSTITPNIHHLPGSFPDAVLHALSRRKPCTASASTLGKGLSFPSRSTPHAAAWSSVTAPSCAPLEGGVQYPKQPDLTGGEPWQNYS